jgi:hypothetical protein
VSKNLEYTDLAEFTCEHKQIRPSFSVLCRYQPSTTLALFRIIDPDYDAFL